WVKHGGSCAEGDDPASMQSRFSSWRSSAKISGGFVWVADDVIACSGSFADYASAINSSVGGGGGGQGNGRNRVVGAFSGKCLDVSGSGTADGTKVQEWTCNGSGAQTFYLASTDGGDFQIINDNSNKCIDISRSGTADGTPVQLWSCNGTGAQAFRLGDLGGGAVKLVNASSGKCVDISGAGTADGTQVQLYTCNGTGAQAWQLQPR